MLISAAAWAVLLFFGVGAFVNHDLSQPDHNECNGPAKRSLASLCRAINSLCTFLLAFWRCMVASLSSSAPLSDPLELQTTPWVERKLLR